MYNLNVKYFNRKEGIEMAVYGLLLAGSVLYLAIA